MSKTKKLNPKPNGRPQKNIDWDRVNKLLMAGCMGTEIAPQFDLHPESFYRRVEEKFNIGFTEYMTQKRCQGDSILREAQFDKAIGGDNTMLVWLGKNRLNQKETPNEISVDDKTVKSFGALMSQIADLQKKAD